MKLKDIKDYINEIEIFRDGEFDTLGLNISNNNMLTLTFLEDERYINSISSDINCVITTKDIATKINSKMGVIISDYPRNTFFKLHNNLANNNEYIREKYNTSIGLNCNISNLSSIAKNNVTIGNNVIIEEFVIIRENTIIGDNCIIRSGAKIGGEGFEVKRNNDTTFSVIHLGGVVIGDNVEIQYNTCVDKAVYPWDNTVISDYCKIDNLVYIAHGCKIGKATEIAASTTIGGRTVIGEKCWVGLNVTIRNGLTIGNGCNVNMGAVATQSIKDGLSVTGNFAIEHSKFIEYIKKFK